MLHINTHVFKWGHPFEILLNFPSTKVNWNEIMTIKPPLRKKTMPLTLILFLINPFLPYTKVKSINKLKLGNSVDRNKNFYVKYIAVVDRTNSDHWALVNASMSDLYRVGLLINTSRVHARNDDARRRFQF